LLRFSGKRDEFVSGGVRAPRGANAARRRREIPRQSGVEPPFGSVQGKPHSKKAERILRQSAGARMKVTVPQRRIQGQRPQAEACATQSAPKSGAHFN
jgi:hypothetical protein